MKRIKSPHSEKVIEEAHGVELEAWVAAELDGFTAITEKLWARRPSEKNPLGSEFRGRKGHGVVAKIPNFTTDHSEFKRTASAILQTGRKLVIQVNGKPVSIDDLNDEQRAVALRALILESMKRRGAV